jgi:hypothetical protein
MAAVGAIPLSIVLTVVAIVASNSGAATTLVPKNPTSQATAPVSPTTTGSAATPSKGPTTPSTTESSPPGEQSSASPTSADSIYLYELQPTHDLYGIDRGTTAHMSGKEYKYSLSVYCYGAKSGNRNAITWNVAGYRKLIATFGIDDGVSAVGLNAEVVFTDQDEHPLQPSPFRVSKGSPNTVAINLDHVTELQLICWGRNTGGIGVSTTLTLGTATLRRA